jgi:type II secretory pathway pseudopilin PulG
MKSLLRLLLKSQHQQNTSPQAQTEKGMTLIELLIGMVMAFLIITPMLAFVVDMLNTDRREQVKANTEQDIQAAVDFIAQDLSQAIYIYDGKGVREINTNGYLPSGGTPILVFWKRKQIRNAVSIDGTKTPIACSTTDCNDTYVRSLVAYYLVKETDKTSSWCQPSGDKCPSRIARYEISEGVKDPRIPIVNANGYFNKDEVDLSERLDPAFDPTFDFSKPTAKVTLKANFPQPDVLVNYIDDSDSSVPVPLAAECQTLLGATIPSGGTADDLLITDGSSHSFYVCVDTSKNLARVNIRGNSLRRLQGNNANYSNKSSAFFPTATVQVQGRGTLGK